MPGILGADLRLQRFVGTSERLNVARLCSRESATNGLDLNVERRGTHDESPVDRAVTVRERALIKDRTWQLRFGSFPLNDPA